MLFVALMFQDSEIRLESNSFVGVPRTGIGKDHLIPRLRPLRI